MGKHKEWRKLAKKVRRKRIRQLAAQKLEEDEQKARIRREHSPTYQTWLEEQTKVEEFQAQEEARFAAKREEQWLKAEEEACRNWKELQKKLENAREEKAKQVARIKKEWEIQQKNLKELKEKKRKQEEEEQKRQADLLLQINNFIENGGDVPEELNTNFETNPQKPICPFFNKTGACRFKDICSRNHVRPGISRVLLISKFYSHYSLEQLESEYGTDNILEYENRETYEHFKEFFYDVLPELEKCGHVRQFKVCCNHEVHLRGNVYVEYSDLREAVKGYRMFHGRWYAGKRLHVEFCKIDSWKSAICGLYAHLKCPKGNSCNFLHVFRTPGNLFMDADRDRHRTPTRNFDDYDDNDGSESRNWRWSESPEPIPNSENNNVTHKKSNDRKRSSYSKSHRYKKSIEFRNRSKSRYSRRSKYKSRENQRDSSKSHSKH